MIKLFIFFFLFLISSISISYGNTNYELKDKISKNLRCIVCQGQSIYDSQSEFAESVKLIIEKKIDSGSSEEEIYAFFKERYGDWVLYDPEVSKNTLFLWAFPIIFFILAGILISRKVIIN